MIRKLTTSFIFFFLICAFLFGKVSAQQTIDTSPSPSPNLIPAIEVTYESVNPPDGMPFLLKRVKEKIGLFFSFSNESKINNYKKLTEVRLAELKFIIEKNHMGYFEKSTQRYFTTVGQLTTLVTSKNVKNQYNPIREELLSHIPVLTKLRDNYDFDTAEWRFVEDDINYVKGYIDNLPKD